MGKRRPDARTSAFQTIPAGVLLAAMAGAAVSAANQVALQQKPPAARGALFATRTFTR